MLLIIPEYPPVGAGAGSAARNLAHELANLGHEVRVLTAAHGEMRGTECEGPVTVTRVRSRRRHKDRSNVLEMVSFAYRGVRTVARANAQDYDGAIAFFSLPSGLIARHLAVRAKVPYVLSLRGADVPGLVPRMGFVHWLARPVRRAVLRRARAVVTNSEGLARLCRAADGVDAEVVSNGVDSQHFRPPTERGQHADASRFVALFVGRLHDQKNLGLVLELLARRGDLKQVELVVAGDGPRRASLERAAERLGVASRVRWLGWQDQDRLAEIYRQADCLVQPSFYEGAPNAVLEAMSSGLPVLASRIPGHQELLCDTRTGFFFDLSRADELGDLLLELAADPERGRALGAAARQAVLTDHSRGAVAQRYVALLS